jgi:hypothetical protein
MAQQSNSGEDGVDAGGLDAAARRLERAVSLLEGRVSSLSSEGAAGELFGHDRSQLASDLDAARARERELQDAGAEASLALGQAIAGIQAALQRTEEG